MDDAGELADMTQTEVPYGVFIRDDDMAKGMACSDLMTLPDSASECVYAMTEISATAKDRTARRLS